MGRQKTRPCISAMTSVTVIFLLAMAFQTPQCVDVCMERLNTYVNKLSTGTEMVRQGGRSRLECGMLCSRTRRCVAVNFNKTSGDCQLLERMGTLQDHMGITAFTLDRHAECQTTDLGQEYMGIKSTTVSGRTCQRWDSNRPHSHTYMDASMFLDGVLPENYCRNPGGDPVGLWCYTTDPAMRWEVCEVPVCPVC